jgi:AcrR family transcriptional regulator
LDTGSTENRSPDRPGRYAADADGGAKRSISSREHILDVAAKLFRATDYTKTSLGDIGERAGMKAGSLYYHFASKEELAAEVLRIGVRRVHRAVVSAIDALDPDPDADVKTRLGAAMTAHLETLPDASDYTSAHIRCFPNLPENLRAQLGADRREYEAIWRALLDEAATSGVLPPGMDQRAARLFILGALNWSLEWYDPTKDALAPSRPRPARRVHTVKRARGEVTRT